MVLSPGIAHASAQRTLVIHPGALGDVLLAVPALRAFRRTERAGEVVLAAQARIGELLCALGEVDRAVRFERLGLDAFFVDDAACDPSGELGRAERVVCWFGARDPAFVRRLGSTTRRLVVNASVPGEGLVWQHLLATVIDTDARDAPSPDPDRPGLRVPLHVPGDVRAEGRQALAATAWDGARSLIVVHPGAGGPSKRWPVEGFARVVGAVLGRTDAAVVVHEGPADREPAGALLASLTGLAHLDRPALPALAGALAHARLFIGNDSGVTHLAAAVGVPTLVLSTVRTLPWRSWSDSAETLVVSTSRLDADDVAAVEQAVGRLLRGPVA
jgi:heptosyltransferase III